MTLDEILVLAPHPSGSEMHILGDMCTWWTRGWGILTVYSAPKGAVRKITVFGAYTHPIENYDTFESAWKSLMNYNSNGGNYCLLEPLKPSRESTEHWEQYTLWSAEA